MRLPALHVGAMLHRRQQTWNRVRLLSRAGFTRPVTGYSVARWLVGCCLASWTRVSSKTRRERPRVASRSRGATCAD